jgi:hypothetical protein
MLQKHVSSLLILLISVHHISCSSPGSSPDDLSSAQIGKPPKFDLSTPENAVKTRWAYSQYESLVASARSLNNDDLSDEFYEPLAKTAIQAKRQERFAMQKRPLNNTISKVVIETPTRAIVETNEFRWLGAKKRDFKKYVLVKMENRWLIENELVQCWSCEGTGQKRDFDRERYNFLRGIEPNVTPMKECDSCGGSGWNSLIYEK